MEVGHETTLAMEIEFSKCLYLLFSFVSSIYTCILDASVQLGGMFGDPLDLTCSKCFGRTTAGTNARATNCGGGKGHMLHRMKAIYLSFGNATCLIAC